MISNVKAKIAAGGNCDTYSAENQAGRDMLLGSKCRVRGTLECDGRARIEGAVEGEIRSVGELIIASSADIKAKVIAKRARVYGRVEGDITCTHFLEICSGAHVQGNITSPKLVIHEGVVFEGYCMMQEAQRLAGIDGAEMSINGAESKGETATVLDNSDCLREDSNGSILDRKGEDPKGGLSLVAENKVIDFRSI